MTHLHKFEGGGVTPSPARKPDFSFLYKAGLFAAFILCGSFYPALAAGSGPSSGATITDKGAVMEIGDDSTRLAVDTARGIISIIIEGKEVGRFDKNGLHLLSDLTYGGTITDTGSAYVEKAIAGGDDAP